jgi:sulfate adenylyltransferase subunit 2
VDQIAVGKPPVRVLCAASLRGQPAWVPLAAPNRASAYRDLLERLLAEEASPLCVLLHGIEPQRDAELAHWIAAQGSRLQIVASPVGLQRRAAASAPAPDAAIVAAEPPTPPAQPAATRSVSSHREPMTMNLTHLQRLEAEAIHIMREVVAETENPVMLYSIGKDSACMLRLAQKAFFPSVPPFPLLHVDTMWKFRDMYALRDRVTELTGMKLLVYQNPEAQALGINPFDHGSQIHTDLWKTQGLKKALDHYGFDAAFGGARRDEEKSRAKERIFSFRSDQHRWDPKAQRPELWRLYNARKRQGESMRVFPLSNWTELDVWQYIHLENIPIVPLYFAKERPVVDRDGTLIMVDDERFPLQPGEVPVMRKIRFRTLGCYPLSGGIESVADTLTGIIQEMLLTRTSERQGRLIDHDQAASMEKKKQEGYF